MNTREKATVILLFGGRGNERDISVMGVDFVFPLIDRTKYRAIPVYIDKNGSWLVSCKESATPGELISGAVPAMECSPASSYGMKGLVTEKGFIETDALFPLLHGNFGEDGIVQGALENAGLSFVGCDTVAGAVARDKVFVKLVAAELGIKVAKWVLIPDKEDFQIQGIKETLGYPVFVKPARFGSSLGASMARNDRELCDTIHRAFDLCKSRVLVEELVEIKKELECAYYGSKNGELFTNPGEITCLAGFYDYEAKYRGYASVSDKTSVSENISDKIKTWSKLITKNLGIRDLSRIDFFLSKNDELYFNEINTMPGFTCQSLYPKLVENHGISPFELVNGLIENALKRA